MKKYLSNSFTASILAFLCAALWGSAYPVIKFAYASGFVTSIPDKLVFAGARFLIAGGMVFVLCCIRRRGFPTVPKSSAPSILLYGAVQTGIMYLFNYIGVSNTTATKTSILTASSAFFAVMLAPLFFKDESLTVKKAVGAILGMAGIVIVNLSFDLTSGFMLTGEGFVLIAAVLNTAGSFIGKRAAKGRVFEATAYQLMFGGVILLISGLAFSGKAAITPASIGVTLYLAFVSAAAFTVWTALLVYNEAGKILMFNLFIPITGAVWSYFILSETDILRPEYILSVILVTAGIVLVNSTRKSSHNSTISS